MPRISRLSWGADEFQFDCNDGQLFLSPIERLNRGLGATGTDSDWPIWFGKPENCEFWLRLIGEALFDRQLC